jgi:hypothetical protein
VTYHLSVLDQSPIAAGSTATVALHNTLDLARTADALGYHRYWLAEHHASRSLAGVAPEAMIGPVALATERIRVGSGGIMLPHYSPFRSPRPFQCCPRWRRVGSIWAWVGRREAINAPRSRCSGIAAGACRTTFRICWMS